MFKVATVVVRLQAGGRVTVTERADLDGVVSVLEIQRSTIADSGVYQCRSASDRSVATRRVNVLNGKYNAERSVSFHYPRRA